MCLIRWTYIFIFSQSDHRENIDLIKASATANTFCLLALLTLTAVVRNICSLVSKYVAVVSLRLTSDFGGLAYNMKTLLKFYYMRVLMKAGEALVQTRRTR